MTRQAVLYLVDETGKRGSPRRGGAGRARNRRTDVRLMRRPREMALLLSPFLATALTREAYFAMVGGRP